MKIIDLFPGSWCSNCYLLVGENRHAFVVDPSASATGIIERCESEGITLDGILLTHGHFDHIISLDSLRDKADIPAYIHENDNELLGDARKNAVYTFFKMDRAFRSSEHLLRDGDTLHLGDEKIKIIHTPGHTEGSVCYLCDAFIVTGDTLFADSYGRYDLYGGDFEKLRASMKKLSALDQNLTIYSGHGDAARLGDALARLTFNY